MILSELHTFNYLLNDLLEANTCLNLSKNEMLIKYRNVPSFSLGWILPLARRLVMLSRFIFMKNIKTFPIIKLCELHSFKITAAFSPHVSEFCAISSKCLQPNTCENNSYRKTAYRYLHLLLSHLL